MPKVTFAALATTTISVVYVISKVPNLPSDTVVNFGELGVHVLVTLTTQGSSTDLRILYLMKIIL